jgi:putative hydrolase of the HAD superfamily
MDFSADIQVILFDLGDTLIFFDGDLNDALIRSIKKLWYTLNQLGYKLNPDYFLRDFSTRMQNYYKERDETLVEQTSAKVLSETLENAGFPNPDSTIIREALKQMYATTQKYWKIEPDALETLNWIKKQGFRIGLISNASDKDDVCTLLRQKQLIDYMEFILISAEFGFRKPHPGIFQKALSFFDTSPENCLMVGDKLTMDVIGAQSVGMKTVWKSNRASQSEHLLLDQIEPDLEIKNLGELKKYLKK